MIGVVGLGLIGGSLAKALNENTDYTVCGFDVDKDVCNKAKLINAIEAVLSEDMIPECDIIILSLYPEDTINWLKANCHLIKKNSIVMDCCGVKVPVCNHAFEIAKENDFTFIGGHPMAGLEHSGFEYSKRALFQDASMIFTPASGTDIGAVDKMKKLVLSIGFSNVEITTPEEHDEIIAYTSQLAHVVSSAYIKSPTATRHRGFSAGSYKDLTRVSRLNEKMWTQLFLENPKNLAEEIDGLIDRLHEYSTAIKEGDSPQLTKLLKDGRERKALIDEEYF